MVRSTCTILTESSVTTGNASVYGYSATATTHWDTMNADQAKGRLLTVPTKVVYFE